MSKQLKGGARAENSREHEPCKALAYCPKYSHIISNEMRWKYCHTGEEECYEKERLKRLFQNSLNSPYACCA